MVKFQVLKITKIKKEKEIAVQWFQWKMVNISPENPMVGRFIQI